MNDFDLGDLRRVLAECQEYEAGHHLGRPFMSAYQIAIRFADAHPQHPLVKKLHVGGKGTGPDPSLANCIARFLSAAVKDGKAGDIEARIFNLMYELQTIQRPSASLLIGARAR